MFSRVDIGTSLFNIESEAIESNETSIKEDEDLDFAIECSESKGFGVTEMNTECLFCDCIRDRRTGFEFIVKLGDSFDTTEFGLVGETPDFVCF